MMSHMVGLGLSPTIPTSLMVPAECMDDNSSEGSSHEGSNDDVKPSLQWNINNNNNTSGNNGGSLSPSGGKGQHSPQSPSGGLNGSGPGDVLGGADAEGVWSADIEQAFQEALAIYPPCGRRKIILSDEGKMYGRNELIARYIKLRTGKTRTRKQVSSHIQVLARKKQREVHTKFKDHHHQTPKEKSNTALSSMSSAQIVSLQAMQNKAALANVAGFYGAANPFWQPGLSPPSMPGMLGVGDSYRPPLPSFGAGPTSPTTCNATGLTSAQLVSQCQPGPAWEGRTIHTSRIRLCEFTAYAESDSNGCKHHLVHISPTLVSPTDPSLESIDIKEIADKFPMGKEGLRDLFNRGPHDAFFLVKFWVDVGFDVPDEQAAFYAVDSKYESAESMSISVSTKVCSFGKQVVEKVETEHAVLDETTKRYVYRIGRSPMCEYMVKFIQQLKALPERYMMNSVLENFTILQVVTNKNTLETLLCIAFVFAISEETGSEHHIYRLTHDFSMSKFNFVRGIPAAYSGPVKAVIFDWAGTVVDCGVKCPTATFTRIFADEDVRITEAQARGPMGIHKKEHIAAILRMIEVQSKWTQVKGRSSTETDIQRLYQSFTPILMNTVAQYSTPISGVIECVDWLKARGIAIGSCTGYSHDIVEVLKIHAASHGYTPDCFVAADQVTKGRPDPQMILLNVLQLNVSPMASVVKIDDTVNGIKEGLSAGCWTVAVAKTGNYVGLSEGELKSMSTEIVHQKIAEAYDILKTCGSHFIVDSVQDLPNVIEYIEQSMRNGERP